MIYVNIYAFGDRVRWGVKALTPGDSRFHDVDQGALERGYAESEDELLVDVLSVVLRRAYDRLVAREAPF